MKKQIIFISLLLWVVVFLLPPFGGIAATQEETATTQEKVDNSTKNIKKGETLPPPSEIDSFYEKARFIMTKDEIEIYKGLVTPQEKVEFLQEFWEKRDPTPDTEENESLMEFQERIAYAVKWFQEGSKGRGWDTERGRLLLQLGFPEERRFGQANDAVTSGNLRGRLRSSKSIPMEVWEYYRYSLRLVFADYDGLGRLKLERIPSNLLTTIELVKSRLYLRDDRGSKYSASKKHFDFKSDYDEKTKQLTIDIPIDKISFEERAETQGMIAFFDVKIIVYLDSKKIDEIKKEEILEKSKESLLDMKVFTINIPYTVTKPGKYHLDIIVKNRNAEDAFRRVIKFKN